jgi:hypothetical protein
MSFNDRLIGAFTVQPNRLAPGDVIADMEGRRAIRIDQIKPILINCHGHETPVWWIKGTQDRDDGWFNIPVITVCVPRQPWYRLARSDRA